MSQRCLELMELEKYLIKMLGMPQKFKEVMQLFDVIDHVEKQITHELYRSAR